MEMAPQQLIDKEAINRLPQLRYDQRIHLVTTPAAAELAVTVLRREGFVGFDTESRPAFRKGQRFPVALVQVASGTGVFLFQLCYPGTLAPLKGLLEDDQVKKVGIALHDDVRRLRSQLPFEARSFVEISDHTQSLGIANTGLRALAAAVLGQRIAKGAQLTNWSRPVLSQRQLLYAAIDAWASREIYRVLVSG